MDFILLEKVLLYRDLIVEKIYEIYDIKTYFKEVDVSLSQSRLDEVCFDTYGDYRKFWIILLFNPTLDIADFKLTVDIDGNEYLKNKLDWVYKTKLNKTSYNQSQVENIFELYYERKPNVIVMPITTVVEEIETKIKEITETLINGL